MAISTGRQTGKQMAVVGEIPSATDAMAKAGEVSLADDADTAQQGDGTAGVYRFVASVTGWMTFGAADAVPGVDAAPRIKVIANVPFLVTVTSAQRWKGRSASGAGNLSWIRVADAHYAYEIDGRVG